MMKRVKCAPTYDIRIGDFFSLLVHKKSNLFEHTTPPRASFMEKLTLRLSTIFTKTTLALLGFLDTREIYWL